MVSAIMRLIGDAFDVVINDNDIICQTCLTLMNELDRCIYETNLVERILLRQLNRKYTLGLHEHNLLGIDGIALLSFNINENGMHTCKQCLHVAQHLDEVAAHYKWHQLADGRKAQQLTVKEPMTQFNSNKYRSMNYVMPMGKQEPIHTRHSATPLVVTPKFVKFIRQPFGRVNSIPQLVQSSSSHLLPDTSYNAIMSKIQRHVIVDSGQQAYQQMAGTNPYSQVSEAMSTEPPIQHTDEPGNSLQTFEELPQIASIHCLNRNASIAAAIDESASSVTLVDLDSTSSVTLGDLDSTSSATSVVDLDSTLQESEEIPYENADTSANSILNLQYINEPLQAELDQSIQKSSIREMSSAASISKMSQLYYRCKTCPFFTQQEFAILYHSYVEHDHQNSAQTCDAQIENKPRVIDASFRCYVCAKVLTTWLLYCEHVAVQHKRYFVCNRCGILFTNSKRRDSHEMKQHTFKCSSCGLDFLLRLHLDNHVNHMHSNIFNFSCKICKAKFFHKSHYMRHNFMHKKETTKEHSMPGHSRSTRSRANTLIT